MRVPDGQVEGCTKRGNNERVTLAEGAIVGLGGNHVLGKFPGIHMHDTN